MTITNVSEREPAPGKITAATVGSTSSTSLALPVITLMAVALLASGAAGLMNEVFWQRSLKRFLGGSETISSTIVILVFMGGLGTGALLMGNRARRFRDPLGVFALVEVLLWTVNLGVCWLLSTDVSHSVFAFQRAAAAVGLPLQLLYAVFALLILALPCLLMGATLPLASEVLQRRLGLRDPRVIGLLLFVNTFGSVLGCVLASAWLVPRLGFVRSLLVAASLNLVAAVALWALRALLSRTQALASPGPVADPPPSADPPARRGMRMEEVLALGLGFCSLAYEMLLFRVCSLIHEPLPFTFAMVLTGFLLYWSIGAALASRLRLSLSTALGLCAALQLGICAVLLEPGTSLYISGPASMLGFVLTRAHYFLPCLLFGFLFARVASQAARTWGRDVGRVYAWNTVGSCLGILAMTFVGYGLHLALAIPALALVTFSLWAYHREASRTKKHGRLPWAALPLSLCLLLLLVPRVVDSSRWFPAMRVFFGRDGVVGVSAEGHMFWDGLWHSKLSQEPGDQVGGSNWWMAACPVLAHGGEVEDVCVIGAGVGITAVTLSRLPAVDLVDAYEINHTLERVYRDYPEGTYHVAEDPRVRVIWQDGRTGLALREKKYDVVTTAPLYLRQTGAALLNSLEFYRQLQSRLKPGGVLCLYAYGTNEQAFAVRQTAKEVFEHGLVCYGGYLLLLSDSPIDLSAAAIEERLSRHPGNPFWDDVRAYAGEEGAAKVADIVDEKQLSWGDGQLIITDDRPIVEYPHYLRQRVAELGYTDDHLKLRHKEEYP